ncbi:MAG: hypothetical protein NUW01_01630 [Gemmatimonadaceae bacterium]|nr:hypothetical protein [Gemmatimonadaceae bacterium]
METMTDTLYKVLDAAQQPHHGGTGRWTKGRWRTATGPLVPCENGIHYCRRDQLVRWLGPTIWLFEDGSPGETVDAGDKMVTRKGRVVERVDAWNDVTARLLAADVAEIALRFIPGSREPFVAAIAAARGFARGEVGDKELVAASAVASAAALAAAKASWLAVTGDSAGDAARAAARASSWESSASYFTGDSAGDAARAAARASSWESSAGYSAGDSARAAARAAAWAASWSAARVGDERFVWESSAGYSAWDSARSAATRVQTEILFDYLEGRRA